MMYHKPCAPSARNWAEAESGVVAVLTAILLAVLFGMLALALNHAYSSILQREARAAADATAHAATVSLCATSACWQDAKAAALNTLRSYVVHGRLGAATSIDLDPAGGPMWEDKKNGWRVTVERGRWFPGGRFVSLEPSDKSPRDAVPLRAAANAVRVSVERAELPFIAVPEWLAGRAYSMDARTTVIKGRTQAGCVAPFALDACALHNGGEFAAGTLTSADRLFTRSHRYCSENGASDSSCSDILPEFFYNPTGNQDGPSLVVNAPTCSWNNPRFEELPDHFGVVGLPESAGAVSEEKVRAILENSSNPCVPAKIGERFLVLEAGLTERATDEALWRQISVAYDTQDPSHPPYSRVFKNTTVSTKTHDPRACSSTTRGELGWGACNSRRYVYNGVRGHTFFPSARFDHGFQPGNRDLNTTWPAASPDTPLWRVQVPVIAPQDTTMLRCPAQGGGSPTLIPGSNYEIIGFVEMNVFDTDIGWPAPLNPSALSDGYGWGQGGGDPVWGFGDARGELSAGVGCYPADGSGTAKPECSPCNIVRGRVADETDYIATDQSGEPMVSLVFDEGVHCLATAWIRRHARGGANRAGRPRITGRRPGSRVKLRRPSRSPAMNGSVEANPDGGCPNSI